MDGPGEEGGAGGDAPGAGTEGGAGKATGGDDQTKTRAWAKTGFGPTTEERRRPPRAFHAGLLLLESLHGRRLWR